MEETEGKHMQLLVGRHMKAINHFIFLLRKKADGGAYGKELAKRIRETSIAWTNITKSIVHAHL